MNSLNTAQIIGNLTRDPELRQTQSGQSVCTVGVATNRRWTDSSGQKKEEAEFHNVVCWGKLAEIVNEYIKKGDKVFFSGRLQTRNWEDEAGIKHYRTEIVAQDMIMLSPKSGGAAEGTSTPIKASADSEPEISAEDLPF
jgi:single-strand DNA-binding protein